MRAARAPIIASRREPRDERDLLPARALASLTARALARARIDLVAAATGPGRPRHHGCRAPPAPVALARRSPAPGAGAAPSADGGRFAPLGGCSRDCRAPDDLPPAGLPPLALLPDARRDRRACRCGCRQRSHRPPTDDRWRTLIRPVPTDRRTSGGRHCPGGRLACRDGRCAPFMPLRSMVPKPGGKALSCDCGCFGGGCRRRNRRLRATGPAGPSAP